MEHLDPSDEESWDTLADRRKEFRNDTLLDYFPGKTRFMLRDISSNAAYGKAKILDSRFPLRLCLCLVP
jgi:hypothetical protein